MTTPGGVPNLPVGALTLDTMQAKLQDMSDSAMKNRAVERFPSIMDSSTGLSPASDFTPFGILTRIFAGVQSLIATSDPADIQGPEDIPDLLLEFIEGLPVVGQFVELLEAIIGGYDGDDHTLRLISQFFAPIRALAGQFQGLIDALVSGLTGGSSTGNDPVSIALGLLSQTVALPFSLLAQLFGQHSTQQAQITALQSGGFSYDVAVNGVVGWTNLVGTLAVSARGKFIQAATRTVAYRASGLAVDKYGVHAALTPSMRGTCRLGICPTSAGANYAALEVYRGFDGDALRLVTGSSPVLTVVQKQADYIGAQRLPEVLAVDVKTDGVNKFTVLCNGQPVPALDFTDSGGIVTHGASNRGVLLTSNGFNRNEDGFYGPAFTKVVSYAV